MPPECVLDTSVLQKANAPLVHVPRDRSLFVRRLNLLKSIRQGRMTVLISAKLLAEYQKQIKVPRNDQIRAFFELVLDPRRRVLNWAKDWSGGRREKARKCRYPKHDDHILRTALRPHPTTIFSEDDPMLKADACIYRYFNVHIRLPP